MNSMHNSVESVRMSAMLLLGKDALQKPQPLRGLRPAGRSRHFAPSVAEQPGVSTQLSPLAVSLSKVGLTPGQMKALADPRGQRLADKRATTEGGQLAVAASNPASAQSLELESHYRDLQYDASEARPLRRAYVAHLRLGVSQVSRNTASPFLREADIMSMVQLMMKDVRSTIAGDRAEHAGVVLGKAELEDLLAENGGRTVNHFMDMIDLTIMLARLKQLLDDGQSEVPHASGQNGSGGTESPGNDLGEPVPADGQ